MGKDESLRPVLPSLSGDGRTRGTGKDQRQGLIIEIDESGNEVRRLTATIPSLYPHPTENANVWFKAAFKTLDGGALAFGAFQNIDAPFEDKQYDWNVGIPGRYSDPDHFNKSFYLLNGDTTNTAENLTLLRKYDRDGAIIIDLRNHNREITALYKYPDGSFLATTPDRMIRIDADMLNRNAVSSPVYICRDGDCPNH